LKEIAVIDCITFMICLVYYYWQYRWEQSMLNLKIIT